MTRAAAWTRAGVREDPAPFTSRRGEPRIIATDTIAQDFDHRLRRMESLLNSLLETVQASADAERHEVSDGDQRTSPRPRPQRRQSEENRQWPQREANAPILAQGKIAPFTGNKPDNKRASWPDERLALTGFDELQSEISGLAGHLGVSSRVNL